MPARCILQPMAGVLAPPASLVRALADCTRARARTTLNAVLVALNLTWWCRYCSWTGRQRHRRRAARCSSTVSPMLPPSVEPALCLSGKGGCGPLVKCLAYVVRSRCCPCQAMYARTSASQDPAKALWSTRRWSRLAGMVCAARWRSTWWWRRSWTAATIATRGWLPLLTPCAPELPTTFTLCLTRLSRCP